MHTIHTSDLVLVFAYIVDRIVGDPQFFIPHPVILLGKCISGLERLIRSIVKEEANLKWAGMFLPLVLIIISYGSVWAILTLLVRISPILSFLAGVWVLSTTIATKGLADAGLDVYNKLKDDDLIAARHALSMVVSRDTEHLEASEVSRGAIETVAENIVDAIVSPLFYAAIGGVPLAMAYRAVNTLDSMVGYKNDKYKNLGWASAKLDDLANLIPARIAGVLIVFVSWYLKLNWRGSWNMMRRDARKHPSPNGGFPESAVAGALNIQVGGENRYFGVSSYRAVLGDPIRSIQYEDIRTSIQIMKHVSVLFLLLCFCTLFLLNDF
jgi:adenosylcobinamide-phosphate synthase